MCRFAAYLGPPIRLAALLTRPDRSLVQQARHSYEGTEEVNPDGWGVAWYQPEVGSAPALFKDVTPAWRSSSLPEIARRVGSGCILAHVRAATAGLGVSQANCHPFTWRDLSFMHNGAVKGFDRMGPALRERLSLRARRRLAGTTDSELLFALLTDRWLELGDRRPLERLAEATRRTLHAVAALRAEHGVTEPAYLNLALSDGQRLVVSRATAGEGAVSRSLYFRSGRRVPRGEGPSGRSEPFVLVASEPLEITRRWTAVEPEHLVLVDETRRVTTEAVGAAGEDRQVA